MLFQIFGERCSGTNYLEHLLKHNFGDACITWEFGHKHWFIDHDKIKNSPFTKNTVFIVIVRNLRDWLHSFYNNPHHLCNPSRDIGKFLTHPCVSLIERREEHDNVFQLRASKLQDLFKLRDETQVPNIIYIRYETIRDDPVKFIEYISHRFNMKMLHSEVKLVTSYKGLGHKEYTPSRYRKFSYLQEQLINRKTDWSTETRLEEYLTPM